jgi:hypothetical protein
MLVPLFVDIRSFRASLASGTFAAPVPSGNVTFAVIPTGIEHVKLAYPTNLEGTVSPRRIRINNLKGLHDFTPLNAVILDR